MSRIPGIRSRPGRLTPARRKRIDALLDRLLDLPPDERSRRLEALATRCPRIHGHVSRLVDASTAPTDFLQTLFERMGRKALSDPPADCDLPPGTRIGGWRLIERAGAGGMGLVYRAERADDAFEMQVALKLIRRLDPALARQLEIERRLLAKLDHPNVARLIDGGLTDDGWAWLAMEWVDGVDLGDWVADQPETGERLKIFAHLADAVGQAHRRRIVHGDIKPANVRVAPDGRPRLLDFGVARLLGDDADKGLAALTPAFAAPEQKRGEPVTPQSDVYSLGALLYWLLTRRTPADDEPVERLARLRGVHRRGRELAAMIARATEGDPDRRYDGVADLLRDLEAFRTFRPLLAVPTSRRYVMARFLQRNRAGVTLAGLCLLMMVAGVAGIAWQGRIAIEQRDRAEIEARTAERVTGFLIDLFEQADPERAQGRDLTARELVALGTERIDELDDEPAVQTRVLSTLGSVHRALGDYESAELLLRRALAQADRQPFAHPVRDASQRAELQVRLGELLTAAGRFPEARELTVAALALLPPGSSAERADTLNNLGNIAYAEGDFERSEQYYRGALEMHRALDPGGEGEALARLNLGSVFAIRDEHLEARDHFQTAWTMRRARVGDDHPDTANALYRVADSQVSMGELEAAEATYLQVLERYRAIYGDWHPKTAWLLHSIGILKWRQGDLAAAEPYWTEALEIRRDVLDPMHPDIGASLNAMTFVMRDQGRLEEAYRTLIEVLEIARTRFGDPHYAVASTLHNLGILALELGRLDEAERRLLEAYEMRRELLGEVHSEVAISQEGLARLARERGERAEALSWARQSLATFREVHGHADHPEAQRTRQLLTDLEHAAAGD